MSCPLVGFEFVYDVPKLDSKLKGSSEDLLNPTPLFEIWILFYYVGIG